jgi:hypothetical protein
MVRLEHAGILISVATATSAWIFAFCQPASPPLLEAKPAAASAVTSADAATAPDSGAPATSAAAAAPALPPGPPGHFLEAVDVSTFQRGNIHTHTKWSDGDSSPEDVYGWYKKHGYNFLAITDHNGRTNPALFRSLETPTFVLVPGEEITMTSEGHPVHVNGLCTKSTIGGGRFHTATAALAWGIKQVLAQGAVALVNHPNFDWALTPEDVMSAKGAQLLEIASGHPYVHTEGDATHPSHEAIWDQALTAGGTFAGVAVDDAHHLKKTANEDAAARPGRAWVQVFAPKADRKAICAALGAGQLYSSTGVALKRIAVKDDTFTVWPEAAGADVEFIAQGGLVVQHGKANGDAGASYKLRGGEAYVRARVTGDDGKKAWTQPSRVGP